MEIFIALGVLVCIVVLLQSFIGKQKKIGQGKKGEMIVAKSLNFWLKRKNKTYVYNDILLKTKRGNTTQIDHLVLSRKGIFVIETKFLNGYIYGDVESKNWKHINLLKQENIIYNPIFQNNGHIKHIVDILGISRSKVNGIVTNVGKAKMRGSINPMLSKTAIEVGTGFVFKLYMKSGNVFTQKEVNGFRAEIERNRIENSKSAEKTHIDYARKFQKRGKNKISFFGVVFVLLGIAVTGYLLL